MASSSNSSVSSQCGVTSPRRSPIARIRHARIVHNQLREWQKPSRIRLRQGGVAMEPPRSDLPADGIDRLARELLELRRQSPSEVAAHIGKIGSHEKDTLILHLLDQVTFLHSQRDDVVAVGEQLTTQLAHQQHDLRVQFQAKTTRLQQQLDQAVHHHPQVTRLEETIAELHQTNTELEQQLLFAAKKLHRSRQRERALRMEQENDPLLWNL